MLRGYTANPAVWARLREKKHHIPPSDEFTKDIHARKYFSPKKRFTKRSPATPPQKTKQEARCETSEWTHMMTSDFQWVKSPGGKNSPSELQLSFGEFGQVSWFSSFFVVVVVVVVVGFYWLISVNFRKIGWTLITSFLGGAVFPCWNHLHCLEWTGWSWKCSIIVGMYLGEWA